MDSAELTEWMAYDRIDPFGDQREDLRTGIIAAAVVNHSMSPPKKPRSPTDFMLFAEKPKRGRPIFLSDPKAQSALIKARIFGLKP